MMPLHPEVERFLQQTHANGGPPIHELGPEQARKQVAGMAGMIGRGPAVASVEDIVIPARNARILARLYRPVRSHGTLVWFHGGGWVVGGIATHDAMCRVLANASGCTVTSVAYRLAPEHPFPVPLDDCWEALAWAAAEAPSSPLVVAGESAGGNMAAVCAIRARDRGAPRVALQVLVYPVTDHVMSTPSYRKYADGPLMGKSSMVWYWDQYLPDVAARDDPEASPLRTGDLSELPPAIVVTAEYDPLRDEGLAYAERLRQAGVPVSGHHYEDMPHPFFPLVNLFTRADEAVERVGREIRTAIAGSDH
jgi:acetyl esterase